MQSKSNEQYWRDRYGMPPRVEERSVPRSIRAPIRRRRRLALLLRHRPTRLFPLTTQKNARYAVYSLVKVLALGAFALWVASSEKLLPAADNSISETAPFSLTRADAGPSKPAGAEEAHLAAFAAARETGLVALRGYLLTGSPGFKTEWLQAVNTVDLMQAAIDQDSRSWTDGRRLMQLSGMRKTAAELRENERILVSIIATPNRFPGLRVYREDVDPALAQALTYLDEALQSALLAHGTSTADTVDLLARVRGDLRDLRQQLLVYLPSSEIAQPVSLRTAMDEYRASSAKLSALRELGAQKDKDRFIKLSALLRATDAKLQQILALKQSPRWDYADYSFKQKILPLTENILRVVDEWKVTS